jgi:hypothetical protein
MNPRISDKIRVFLSGKYLDWAETLPKFNGSFVMKLQHIRGGFNCGHSIKSLARFLQN